MIIEKQEVKLGLEVVCQVEACGTFSVGKWNLGKFDQTVQHSQIQEGRQREW